MSFAFRIIGLVALATIIYLLFSGELFRAIETLGRMR